MGLQQLFVGMLAMIVFYCMFRPCKTYHVFMYVTLFCMGILTVVWHAAVELPPLYDRIIVERKGHNETKQVEGNQGGFQFDGWAKVAAFVFALLAMWYAMFRYADYRAQQRALNNRAN